MGRPEATGRVGCLRRRACTLVFSSAEKDKVGREQSGSLPQAVIEVQDASRFDCEIWVAGKDPTAMLPRPKGIGIQPGPQGSAADLSHQALRHYLLLDIGDGESREWESQTMRKLTGEGLYLNDDAGGENRAGRPPRGCSSRPGRRAKANRLRHLLTICRGVSKRVAMTSLDNPCAAKRTILARMTSLYGDVYFRARVCSFSCSMDVSTMRNGLERDKAVLS